VPIGNTTLRIPTPPPPIPDFKYSADNKLEGAKHDLFREPFSVSSLRISLTLTAVREPTPRLQACVLAENGSADVRKQDYSYTYEYACNAYLLLRVPDGESPFTLHSTVYPQLARGWATYSGRTGVFLPAARPGSSGVDRFLCSGQHGNEDSERNVDAGAPQIEPRRGLPPLR